MIQIFSDFSDTICKPKYGGKFLPFELELAKLVRIEIGVEYEDFLKNRRNDNLSAEERMLIWLSPFTGKLELKHIKILVETFEANENYIKAVNVLKRYFGIHNLYINIVSGTLWQIVDEFLKLNNFDVEFDIGATKLSFDKLGRFDGQLQITNKLAFAKATDFPKDYLILGDNAMEKYEFGEHLLNVQDYNENVVKDRLNKLKY